MNTERTTRFERVLPGLFDELAGTRTPAYLEAAIERASSGPQRPSWTFPGTWVPVDITTRIAPVARMPWRQLAILALVGILVALAAVAYVGSQQKRLPAPFGPAANGTVAIAQAGDIFVADRPGGDLRPLVTGPEDDSGPMFSPDGTRLAFFRDSEVDGGLMIADADGTNVVQVATEASLGAESRRAWTFAPDGRSFMTVAHIDGEYRVVIRPVDPAAALTVLDIPLPCCSWEIEDPRFRPTNPQEILVVTRLEADGGQGLYVYDLATGGIRTIVEPADGQYVQDVAWLPDGKHIIYGRFNPHIVAADGSGDHALDALNMDRISPVSNDGARVVVDVAEVDLPGDDSHQKSVVVPIDGEGERVELACGLGTDIECAWSWIWSPDDSVLIGAVPHGTSSSYLLANTETGQVTKLNWGGRDFGTPAWQRVAP
jgi:WD40 repeat protein